MSKIVYICGGARSGKSSFALKLAKEDKGRVTFIATGEPKDEEMKERIACHRLARPKAWITFEEPVELTRLIEKIGKGRRTIVIDCLTLWVSNLLLKKTPTEKIAKKAAELAGALKKMKGRAIVVTNEVGLGIVPANKLARDFRDIAGRVNQLIASECDEAYFMISGIATKIKPTKERKSHASQENKR